MRIAPGALTLCLALLGAVPAAHAARPMITDDARIVDAKACQVEAWARRNRDSTEYWALPACNPTGNAELTFGGARTQADGESAFTDNLVQAKTIFRPLQPEGWGIGLAVGAVRKLKRESANGWPGDPYFYSPISLSLPGDWWTVHLNLGAQRNRAEGRNVFLWGLGNEIALRDDLFFIPEIFHNESGRPFYQLGLRYWVVKDRLQLDSTYGNRAEGGSKENWFSIGLRILTPAFLP
jgi:hypothetical protein